MKHHKISRTIKIAALAGVAIAAIFVGLRVSNITEAAFSGAIYTSTGDGSTVNLNLYPSKDDVFLNGGPQNANSNGLPDGTYYFQVTTPNGTLLSTDNAVCRQLQVINGVIFGASPAAGACAHADGVVNSVTGAKPVQLQPFDDTTNAGGEYKVWLIRQASTTSISTTDPKVINFSGGNSKTDNFKVERPVCEDCDEGVVLSGRKFYDANASATQQTTEGPVAGIKIIIECTDLNGDDCSGDVTTDANGEWSFTVPTGATYKVYEVLPCVDANNDLICDAGYYWVQTAPVADSAGFQGHTGTAQSNVTGLNFGDTCFGPASGGFTLGFWSNKNGERTMGNGVVDVNAYPATLGTNQAADLQFLRNLKLKNANGTEFEPNNYAAFRTWLLSGNAVNMAYMLSVQLSATSLNVRHKFLSDLQIVDARLVCNNVGSCLGFEQIGNIRQGADISLGTFGQNYTISGDPFRSSQELMKNFLDGVNNNRLPFAQGMPCSVFYAPPPPDPLP
jgi:hypothetical protein